MFPKAKKRASNDVTGLITELSHSDSTFQPVKNVADLRPGAPYVPAETVEKMRSMADEIKASAEKLNADMPPDKKESLLYGLISDVAMLDMTARTCLLERKNDSFLGKEKELVKRSNIRISTPTGTVIRVTLPPLIGRQFKGSYNIYWKLKSALSQYEISHGMPRPEGEKLLLIYKRYSTNLAVGHTCDNDNWEMKRTTNAISEALNYSDNADHFSMLYTTVQSHVDCVEATVIKQRDMALFLNYLSDAEPECNIFVDAK